MIVVFISDFFSHHQEPFAESMRKKGVEYWFVSVNDKMSKERRRMGFSDAFGKMDYVLYAHKDKAKVKELIKKSDLVISSYVGLALISARLWNNQLTFIETERLFKKSGNPGVSYVKNFLRKIKYKGKLYRLKKSSCCYFLLIGQYAIEDHLKCGVNPERIMKFAYFPAKSIYGDKRYLSDKTVKFLWAGRMVKWKHPEYAVNVVKRLHKEGYAVSLMMIGTGPLEKSLKAASKGYHIQFAGSVSFQNIRSYMHNADIYLFTSDYEEGWGCVLSEAMSEGTAAVASNMAGSTTFLIEDGINGAAYDGSEEQLYDAVLSYMNNHDLIRCYGLAARKQIESRWNSDIAAENLLIQFKNVRGGADGILYDIDGPCGKYVQEKFRY